MNKPVVFLLGKLPPPYYGPAISTEILLNSSLQDEYELVHIDVKLNDDLDEMGKFAIGKILRIARIYSAYIHKLISDRPALILVPIGQTTPAFLKDALFISIGRLSGSRVLIQLHGSNWLNWLGKSGKLTRWFVRRMLRLSSGVIVLGNNLRYLFENEFGPERIFVVPNGADYVFPEKDSSREGTALLYLANHFPGKGIDIVLNAIACLAENYEHQFTLEVIGSWCNTEFELQCKNFVMEHNLPVTFFDSKSGEEKFRSLVNADIFVFPPKTPEGHPWVIVEAMAAGLPVISTDQGAIMESVHNGFNGFIVEAGNHVQIAEKIDYLISHPDVRNEMGRRSRELYKAEFTEERMISKLSYAISKVLERDERS